MVRTYNKSVFRMLKSNIVRVLTISLIIAIGISLVTGICGLPGKIRDAIANAGAVTEQTATAEIIADKVEMIGYIIPMFFVAVAALTALTTIARLVEEERPIIACLKTLGYSNTSILMKYIVFAVICSLIGCALGIVIGSYALVPLLYEAVTLRFDLGSSTGAFYIAQGVLWSIVMCAAVILTATIVCLRKCKEKPAYLLRAKSPKAGKKIILEYMPLIWKPLKFKYKSSIRNIFRYKGRLFMTMVCVIGSTIMLFCGIGMFGALKGMRSQKLEFSSAFIDSIIPISIAIIIFASALAVLVLFNLTNINIEERKREIATLKVLGYSQPEVAGFIYREILLISAVGIIIGVPLGYGVLGFVFDYIEFGSLSHVKWFIWIITAAVAIVSVILTDFLLYWKIKKIDMSSSLKTID